MQHRDENVILFPKWKTTLKEESFQALQEKRYEEALDKLNELIHYQVENHEIIIGKMICLMELGRYQEAEDLCEEVIQNKQDEHYYHYVHIYLTILFQTNKYSLLMERIQEELNSESLPPQLREQFLQLYDMSEKMETDIVEEKSSRYFDDLMKAVGDKNHDKQWRLVTMLRTMKKEPDKDMVLLLKADDIHPVIKTAIVQWLQESNYSSLVNVRKLGRQLHVNPDDLTEIRFSSTFQETLYILREMEQENPTLFQFLEQLLYRYFYVLYPLLPSSDEAELIAEALRHICNQVISGQSENTVWNQTDIVPYIEEILECEQLYLSIIEE